ncbi:hypothetical protein QC762_0067630 [Podospora pseudocomata]|uniref:Uncharacterized protein n=1 Tax=Podospora pseudocomata TaxID=2093779 RepID=A0ABR0GFX3_9PEZI|nr:hypothetical protein QC762_0067630 [Podospora pseudocomata]
MPNNYLKQNHREMLFPWLNGSTSERTGNKSPIHKLNNWSKHYLRDVNLGTGVSWQICSQAQQDPLAELFQSRGN